LRLDIIDGVGQGNPWKKRKRLQEIKIVRFRRGRQNRL
jgi:hypothetical protein